MDFQEKRDFERVKINTAVSLTYSNPEKIAEGICRDISKSGIGLDLDTSVPIGTECMVRIHDGHKNKKRFQGLIEIKRIEPLSDDRCIVGAIILEKY